MENIIDESYSLMIDLIKRAGVLSLEGYITNNKRVATKLGEWDVVTYYDEAIEKLIIDEVSSKFPNHKFLAEESTAKIELSDDPTWIIDPIDGTSNYVHKIPFFAINIAFAVNKELQFGATFIPKLDELYTARKGQGAFLNGNRIHCSNDSNLKQSIIVYETLMQFNNTITDTLVRRIHKLLPEIGNYHNIGSTAVVLCMIARGCVSGCVMRDLKPWDLAPGAILIAEAGGRVTLDDGSPFDPVIGSIIAGCNEYVHSKLESIIKEADQI